MTKRSLANGGGFVVGAAVGGTLGWLLGSVASAGGTGLIWGLLFLLSFIVMLFGIVAPLTVVRYFTDRFTRSESGLNYDSRLAPIPLKTGRQMGSAIGYVATAVFYVVFAAVGIHLYGGGSEVDAFLGLVIFDTVAGVAWGGIAGITLVSRWQRGSAKEAIRSRLE